MNNFAILLVEIFTKWPHPLRNSMASAFGNAGFDWEYQRPGINDNYEMYLSYTLDDDIRESKILRITDKAMRKAGFKQDLNVNMNKALLKQHKTSVGIYRNDSGETIMIKSGLDIATRRKSKLGDTDNEYGDEGIIILIYIGN